MIPESEGFQVDIQDGQMDKNGDAQWHVHVHPIFDKIEKWDVQVQLGMACECAVRVADTTILGPRGRSADVLFLHFAKVFLGQASLM